MPLNRKNVTISLPTATDDASPYDLTESGAFREGDFEIDRKGLRISGVGTPTGAGSDADGREGQGRVDPAGRQARGPRALPDGGDEAGREIARDRRSRAVNVVEG
jgi:hypothetical protein